ncbi:hypothetical protein JCM16303_001219 [Sporobolomyces ruberrimus]
MVTYAPLPLTSEQRSTLISSALSARDGSYSPYSKFRVGACMLKEDGGFVKGANVECASYGGAICAERTAIVKAVSEGTKKFIGLAVTSLSSSFLHTLCPSDRELTNICLTESSDVPAIISPCGICRQLLREFCPLDMPILLVPSNYEEGVTKVVKVGDVEGKGTEGVLVETTMGELLPLSFGPEDLDKPRDRS